ncbi:hypothetical protein ACFX2A_022066 [Malus domestica]
MENFPTISERSDGSDYGFSKSRSASSICDGVTKSKPLSSICNAAVYEPKHHASFYNSSIVNGSLCFDVGQREGLGLGFVGDEDVRRRIERLRLGSRRKEGSGWCWSRRRRR